jgi:hypothetical protein
MSDSDVVQPDSFQPDSFQPDSSLGPLEILDRAAQTIDGTTELALSARQAFQLLEPFCQATTLFVKTFSSLFYAGILKHRFRSVHPKIKDIIAGIKDNAINYFAAIDMSVHTSQSGVAIAGDAISLCDFLRDGESEDDLVAYIQDMQERAQEAVQEARNTVAKFKEVRQGLNQVHGDRPPVLEMS